MFGNLGYLNMRREGRERGSVNWDMGETADPFLQLLCSLRATPECVGWWELKSSTASLVKPKGGALSTSAKVLSGLALTCSPAHQRCSNPLLLPDAPPRRAWPEVQTQLFRAHFCLQSAPCRLRHVVPTWFFLPHNMKLWACPTPGSHSAARI